MWKQSRAGENCASFATSGVSFTTFGFELFLFLGVLLEVLIWRIAWSVTKIYYSMVAWACEFCILYSDIVMWQGWILCIPPAYSGWSNCGNAHFRLLESTVFPESGGLRSLQDKLKQMHSESKILCSTCNSWLLQPLLYFLSHALRKQSLYAGWLPFLTKVIVSGTI